jgi:hypothetical protein
MDGEDGEPMDKDLETAGISYVQPGKCDKIT